MYKNRAMHFYLTVMSDVETDSIFVFLHLLCVITTWSYFYTTLATASDSSLCCMILHYEVQHGLADLVQQCST